MCSVFTATFYYGLGHIMKNKINILLSMKCKVIFSAILLAIPCAFVLITKQSINLSDNYIPSPEAIYVLVSIIGSTGLLLLAMVKNNNKIWGGVDFVPRKKYTYHIIAPYVFHWCCVRIYKATNPKQIDI